MLWQCRCGGGGSVLNQTDMIFLTGLKSLFSQESTTVSSKVTAFLFALEQTRLVAIRDRHDPIPPPQKQKRVRTEKFQCATLMHTYQPLCWVYLLNCLLTQMSN